MVFAEDEIEQATAVTMKMRKIEGTIKIADKNKKAVSVFNDMRLYNGYKIDTSKKSYAWIDLDSSKLIKLDADSRTIVQKNGKELDIILEKGRLFFDVAEPLADDEKMNIRTSTTAVGIRGTCGWIEVVDKKETRVSILEGSVQVGVIDPVTREVKVGTVIGGDTVTCAVYEQTKPDDKCGIISDRFTEKDVPGFVAVDIANDKELAEKIFEKTKTELDLRNLTKSEAQKRLYIEEKEAEKASQQSDAGNAYESYETYETSKSPAPIAPAPSESYEPGAPETPNQKTKIYDVYFNSAGGPSVATQHIAYRDKVAKPADPSKTGYTFGGWYKDDAYTQKWDFDTGTVQGNMTLYARWKVPGNAGTIGDLNWKFDDNTGALSISGMGSMPDVAPWYGYGSDIKTVEIGESVRSSGGYSNRFFSNCSSLTEITVVGNNPYISSEDGILFTKDKKTLLSYPGGKGYISIPPSVTTISSYAFSGCRGSLASVTIPNKVTNIYSSAFKGCTSLASVTIPSGMTYIGHSAFEDCTNLVSVNIPDSVTDIGSLTFKGCTSLANVTIPSGVANIQTGAFAYCSKLESVNIPGKVTRIENSAFAYCSKLESVTISTPSSLTKIDGSAFKGCTSLASVTIPPGVTEIGISAFEDCTSLKSVNIPDKVTSINQSVFSGCSSLASVTIPSGVTEIRHSAFEGCSKLNGDNVYFGGTSGQWTNLVKSGNTGLPATLRNENYNYRPQQSALSSQSLDPDAYLDTLSDEGDEIAETEEISKNSADDEENAETKEISKGKTPTTPKADETNQKTDETDKDTGTGIKTEYKDVNTGSDTVTKLEDKGNDAGFDTVTKTEDKGNDAGFDTVTKLEDKGNDTNSANRTDNKNEDKTTRTEIKMDETVTDKSSQETK